MDQKPVGSVQFDCMAAGTGSTNGAVGKHADNRLNFSQAEFPGDGPAFLYRNG